ncbi:MAG: type II secretion system protein [Candidatus Stahlbacteria bacterium]|nr:type II secretion system protein [Candidatus Stahlbacteria bacterium]
MNKKQGFSLIELIVAIVIVGVLASISVPRFINSKIKANDAKMSRCANELGKAMVFYHTQHSCLPSAIDVHTLNPLGEFEDVNNWIPHFKNDQIDAYWHDSDSYSIFFTDKESNIQYRLSDGHLCKRMNDWVKLW